MDLVFGMPEDDEGQIGLMVITEYVSKLAYVKAIKSKSAAEIANVLWQYICLFGPPKVIITDQGTEFNNEMIKNIVNRVGSEHRVTAAYNPRTNGQTERFNQTFVNSLRKHAEDNHLN